VLGAVMLDHESLYKVRDKLRPESFDQPRHRVLYEAFEALADKAQSIDLISLRAYLAEAGQLDRIGGISALTEIADTVPTAANIEHHAEIVRAKWLGRSLIRGCEEIAARGYESGEPIDALLEHAERTIMQIATGHAESGFSELSEELPLTIGHIRDIQSGEFVGVGTGFQDLDDLTGGLEAGELIIIAARPSMGKTALALNIARNHAVDGGGCVAMFSLEMTKRELVLRMLLGEAERDLSRLRRPGVFDERDMDRLARASTVLEQARMFIDDSGTVTVSDIAARCRRLHREHELTLVVVDYIQLVHGRRSDDRREQEVAEISRSLKLLAKDLKIPIVALSQLNRGPEGRPNKRPQLSDLRESGAIEQDADIVLFIYRDEVYDEDSPDRGIAELIISKQRNGPTGTVRVQFEGRFARFRGLAEREPPPPEYGFASEPDSGPF
jgi:replicative DNA helicase